MLIARADLSKLSIKIPREVLRQCRSRNVHTSSDPAPPYDADCWIGCASCWPHTDDGFRDEVFVTLSLHGEETHQVCDDLVPTVDEFTLVPGDIFVVDPLRRHWLAPKHWHRPSRPWVGLQWEFRRNDAINDTRKLIEELGAIWLNDITDERYKYWRP